jgi:hypothetical protein
MSWQAGVASRGSASLESEWASHFWVFSALHRENFFSASTFSSRNRSVVVVERCVVMGNNVAAMEQVYQEPDQVQEEKVCAHFLGISFVFS